MSPSGQAATSPDAASPALRGRTLAIPFEDVWQAALRLTRGGLRGWSLTAADDQEGTIDALAPRFTGALFDVHIHIRLDQDAQTRVDARAAARKPSTDFGTSRRLLRRFFRALDRTLARSTRRTPAGHG